MRLKRLILLVGALSAWSGLAPAVAQGTDLAAAEARAADTVRKMTAAEKTVLLHGIMPLPIGPNPPAFPAEAIPGAGYVPGIERLGIPSLRETDASLGVAYVFGLRKDGATALPSGLAMASTWNPQLLESAGRMIGSEAHAKGFNVLLAGGVNLMRDPRSGRNFEYLGEDPLLAGTLVGASIRGIQSNHIISTIKHFALNAQETGRKFVDVRISEGAARESDLLAFQLGIEIGQPGAVMCAYNRVYGHQACASDWLLNKVLKQDWKYKGFVMSDWGAVPNLESALLGLDQQSGAQLDPQVFFDKPLAEAVAKAAYATRVDEMNKRVLTAIYAHGLDTNPARVGGSINKEGNAVIAEQVAKQGIVLLRNERNVLPLPKTAKRIALIGGYADSGVLSGAGSSQVQGEDGPAVAVPFGGQDPFSAFFSQSYHRSVPLLAIKAMAPQADVRYRDGRSVSDAVTQAKQADIAIVFATQWASEGFDQADLSLPNGQDALITAVASANTNTIVALETGGPILMPWLDKTAAVVQAWYPGARGAEAIASVLFGDTNPSGHLPITFPASESQLPRPKVDGFDTLEPNFAGDPPDPDARLSANYDIEGSDLGYRWNARKGYKALFPFGYGLSYTSFATSGLATDGEIASFEMKNTGARAGATVTQLYLVSRDGESKQRLIGYQRVELAAGESKKVSLSIDQRLLADWRDGQWKIAAGEYAFALGDSAEALGSRVSTRLSARSWKD